MAFTCIPTPHPQWISYIPAWTHHRWTVPRRFAKLQASRAFLAMDRVPCLAPSKNNDYTPSQGYDPEVSHHKLQNDLHQFIREYILRSFAYSTGDWHSESSHHLPLSVNPTALNSYFSLRAPSKDRPSFHRHFFSAHTVALKKSTAHPRAPCHL